MPFTCCLHHFTLHCFYVNCARFDVLKFSLRKRNLSFCLLVSSIPDSYFLRHELFFCKQSFHPDFRFADDATFKLDRFFQRINLYCAFIIIELSWFFTSLESVHDINGFHPWIFIPKISQPPFLQVEFVGIILRMWLTFFLFFLIERVI